MEKSVDFVKCPYLRSCSKGIEKPELIREDYELQYNADHIVEKVKVGETDIVKEVESHIGEAGLLNAIKNALAHGEDPSIVYGKIEPGVQASVPVNSTLDDLLELSEQNKAKFAKIADDLGVSLTDLQSAIAQGTLDKLIASSQSEKEASVESEGDK